MKILLITDEEWNDIVMGNNVLTNWFSGYDAEFAQIYCSPGLPYNTICHRYFQVSDLQMVRSLYTSQRAGRVIKKPTERKEIENSKQNVKRQGYYLILKSISLYINTPMLMLRDAIWKLGRYDIEGLRQFITEFNPDIVFCPRFFTPKLMRLESLVSTMTNAPFVAFTADNEASLNCYSWSPLFWLRRLAIHMAFKKHVGLYKHYFTFSEEQTQEYHCEYGLPTSTLYKCGFFQQSFKTKRVNVPIRMVYAGRLYCNRWKTLAVISKALDKLNTSEVKIVLEVYTAEALTAKQRKVLGGLKYLNVHAAITPAQLVEEYKKADIALHVESFDKSYRAATRYSFSTKIIDLMASTCAIMAVCWEKHAGYQYLKKYDAAFCVSDYSDILPMLERISSETTLVQEYARKAWECGKENHNRKKIQGQISEVFERVIKEKENYCIFNNGKDS